MEALLGESTKKLAVAFCTNTTPDVGENQWEAFSKTLFSFPQDLVLWPLQNMKNEIK